MPSERDLMLAGQMYDPLDPELLAARRRCRALLRQFNTSADDTDSSRADRARLLAELIGRAGPNFTIEPPFFCDYGDNIRVGRDVYFNFHCTVLDVCPVTLGDRVMLATGVQLLTATHPVDPVERSSGRELGKPITVGSDVWIGGGAIVLPGVTVGDRTVIGAGSVVTRDLPAGVVAVGNPARVIRSIP